MAKILITSEYFGKFDQAGIKLLQDAGHDVFDPFGHRFLSSEDILPHAGSVDAIICDLEKINQEVIEAAPNLRIIARRGVGIDSVDHMYAAQRGIEVARTLHVLDGAVAELVFAYIIQLYRRVPEMNLDMHNGLWNKRMSHSIEGATIGILGMGNIGLEVAKRAYAFDMNVLYFGRSANDKAEQQYGAQKVTLCEILGQSDILSIHLPLNEETKHLLNRKNLDQMKKGSILINTARGALIDEQDLKEMIEQGHLAGAAIDVFDVEPCTDSSLKQFSNVILTPHIGSFTREVFIKMDIAAAQNVIHYFEGGS